MKSTKDIWFTAYLMYKGYTIKEVEKIGFSKGRFYFEISDEEWMKHKLEFNNTEIIKFKGLIEQVKDLCN